MNLDGVIPFTNSALELDDDGMCEAMRGGFDGRLLLVQPGTGQPANRVHVYGQSGRKFLTSTEEHQYEAVTFSRVEFAWMRVGVLCRGLCGGCCCRGKSEGSETRRMSNEGVI